MARIEASAKIPSSQAPSATSTRSLLLAVERSNSPLAGVDGRQVLAQAFSPYGVRTTPNGGVGALGFNGEYQERTGLYLPGSYRAYSPALRRFCQADNLSPFARGGLNAYAWCLGDPVNHIDPDGHAVLLPLIVTAAVVTLGTGIAAGVTRGLAQETLLAISMISGVVLMSSIGAKVMKRRERQAASRFPRAETQEMTSLGPPSYESQFGPPSYPESLRHPTPAQVGRSEAELLAAVGPASGQSLRRSTSLHSITSQQSLEVYSTPMGSPLTRVGSIRRQRSVRRSSWSGQ